MNKPTIIITGANGFIGKSLVKYFSNKGWFVKAFVRHMPVKQNKGVEYCKFSLEGFLKEKKFKDVDYLIHCAFVKFDENKNADKINLEGTSMLLNLCRANNIKMLFLSSFSAHNQAMSHYGKNKLECEKLFNLSSDVILNPGLVIGNSGFASEIISFIKKSSIVPLIGGGRQPLQTIYINDLCFCIHSIFKKKLSGKFYIAESKSISLKEFYKEVAKLQQRKIFFLPLPYFFVYNICKVMELLRLKFPASSENVLGLKQLIKIDTTKDLETLGVSIGSYSESLKLIIKK